MRLIRTILGSWKRLPPRLHLIVGVGALVLLVGFLSLFLFRPAIAPVEREVFETPDLPITVSSSYEDGVHLIEGSVTLRNRCQRLDTVATLDDQSMPAIIRIDITSEHDEGICLEIPETREFSLEVEGPEEALLEIFVNGLPQEGDAL
jgi:hypothetical protein